jgi:cytochrome c oxidase subunit 3
MKHELGTVTTLPTDEDTPKRRMRTGGGMGSGGGGNNGKRGGGGGGGGGGDRKDNDSHFEHNQFTPSKYHLAMWIALLVILMTFAGLISAFVFIAYNKTQEWRPFDLPIQVTISTLLILASSITFEFARRAIHKDHQTNFRRWLVATTVLGAAFISSQLISWFELTRQGIYVSSNPYAGFFYILTAAHALHLVGGIALLGYLILRAWRPTASSENLFKRQTAANVAGMYWHSMDGLWLVLLGLLVFLK